MKPSPRKKILILTSETGGGHVSLADALREQLEQTYHVEIVDPQPGIVHWHYRFVSRHALWLWAAEYRSSDTPEGALRAHRSFTALFTRNLSSVLRHSQPDLIVTTYPFLSYEVMAAMRSSGMQRPFTMLFADAERVHHSWLTVRTASATFATTRETYAQALDAGFDAKRLHLCGWPVRRQFHGDQSRQRSEVSTQLRLETGRFTVFVQGGGEGAARIARTVDHLASIPGIQVILAAGTNRRLLARFQNAAHVHPLAFTRDIAQYMSAADVIMGKAGPNMLMEAVTLGKPFIATTYIPGQEEGNLQFIRRHQLGWVALSADDQIKLILELSTDTAKLASTRESVAVYRRWNSASAATIPTLIELALGRQPQEETVGAS